jgi:hypothetical protein
MKDMLMEKRMNTLADVFAEALTNRAFLDELREKPATAGMLAERGFSLNEEDVAQLGMIVAPPAPKPNPAPPPPPPWEPTFIMANAILIALKKQTLQRGKTARPAIKTARRGAASRKR